MLYDVTRDMGFKFESGFVTLGGVADDENEDGTAVAGTEGGTTGAADGGTGAGGGAAVGGAGYDTTGVGLLAVGTLTGGAVCASKSTDDVFEVTVAGTGGGTTGGGTDGGVGNWVDNGVLPGCKILDGVPPEGGLGFDCLLACFDGFECDFDLADLALPPLVLDDDDELEVSIATKTNKSSPRTRIWMVWNGVKSII